MSISPGGDTWGDVTAAPDGRLRSQDQVLRNVVAEAVLADGPGLHFIHLGKYHRDDRAILMPEIVVCAIAEPRLPGRAASVGVVWIRQTPAQAEAGLSVATLAERIRSVYPRVMQIRRAPSRRFIRASNRAVVHRPAHSPPVGLMAAPPALWSSIRPPAQASAVSSCRRSKAG